MLQEENQRSSHQQVLVVSRAELSMVTKIHCGVEVLALTQINNQELGGELI